MNKSVISPFTVLSTKIIGGVMLLSGIIEYLLAAIPFQPASPQWQIAFTNSVIDRGIVPLVGIGFLVVGYWIESNMEKTLENEEESGGTFKLPIFIVASILGLMFLLLVPLHLKNLQAASTTALGQIQQEVGQNEQRMQAFLAQLNALSQNPERLEQEIKQRQQVIESGQLQGQQLNPQQLQILSQETNQLLQLQELAKTPPQLQAKLDEIKTQFQTRIDEEKEKVEKRAKSQALKEGLRIGIRSLLLAGGYTAIGWIGIKRTLS